MDLDYSSSSSSSVAARLRCCSYSVRVTMSTLTYSFHSSCVSYHGVDFDFENCCEECAKH